jgi:acyl carrier protein
LINVLRGIQPDLAERSIVREDSMVVLGIDSVDRLEVLLLAMEELHVDASLTRFHGAANLGELADMLHACRTG